MPRVANYLCPDSIIDVTTIRTLSWKWCWREVRYFDRKDRAFRSLDDILEGIRELKYFRDNLFRSQREGATQMLQAVCMARYLAPSSSV